MNKKSVAAPQRAYICGFELRDSHEAFLAIHRGVFGSKRQNIGRSTSVHR